MDEKDLISVTILPTKIWIESGFCGERVVVLQHEGMEPFDYAIFNYHYGYTSNASTHAAATSLAIELGAVAPVEGRHRAMPDEIAALSQKAEAPGWVSLEALDELVLSELKKVSHLEYDSQAICAVFWGNVRAKLAAPKATP